MAKETSLREIEKKTYMSYHQDGLLDIFVSVYVLLFGAGIIVNTVLELDMGFIIPAIFPALMVPFWIKAKKQITMPRIGYVKFRRTGANRLSAILVGLMIVGVVVFMLLTFTITQSWASVFRDFLASYSMLIIGVSVTAITSLFAYTMGLKRLYTYGLITLVLFVTGHFIIIPFEYFILTIGFAIMINGVFLLMRFRRKYPLTQGDMAIGEKSL